MAAPLRRRLAGRPAGLALAAALATALGASAAHACGVCVEDKMAATYDHEVVPRALAQRRMVVFCEVEGAPLDVAALQRAAAREVGVEPRSVRVSAEPAALSFALDPAVQPAAAAVQGVARSLGGRVRLNLLRTLPSPSP